MNQRPYQVEALAASLEAMKRGCYRQVVVHATGCGKTVLFSNLAKHHGFKKRVLILVHRDELAQQAADKIAKWNHEDTVGIEMGKNYCLDTDRFVVAGVPTIGRKNNTRIQNLNPADFDAVVIDECHHSMAESYQIILKHFGLLDDNPHKILLLGVTATPKRGDGVGLISAGFDEIVHTYDYVQAVNDGWLAPLESYVVYTGVNLDKIKIQAGDFQAKQLSGAVNTKSRNKAIAKKWLEICPGDTTIGFCVDIQHSKDLAEAFVEEGISAEAVWGNDPERGDKLTRLKSGETTVVFNAQLLVEGFDLWSVRCVINAAPTKSPTVFPQRIGRGTRIEDGIGNLKEALAAGIVTKDRCYLLDCVDSCSKHSLINVNSLFGLPPKLITQGKNILKLVEEVQQLELTKPGIDFSKCTTIQEMQSYALKVDLLTMQYPPEVVENSEFTWIKTEFGYKLMLPKKEGVFITQNSEGWAVHGKIEGGDIGPEIFKLLNEAFKFADDMLRQFGKHLLKLVRRNNNAAWTKDPITANQIAHLKLLLKINKMQEPDWNNMTKKDGQALWLKLSSIGFAKWKTKKVA